MKKRTPDKFWFPWWPDKWIFGSVRIECTVEERTIWVDLLSLASKDDGFIRANEETPYPLSQLSGMLIIPEKTLNEGIEKFIKLGKLIRTKEETLYIAKWDKYQFSERHKRRVNGEMSADKDTMAGKDDAILKKNILDKNKKDKIKEEDKKKPTPKPKILFNFETERWENIEKKDVERWGKTYSACNIKYELLSMADWLISNPEKKKSNYKSFISRWLRRAQDKGGTKLSYKDKEQKEINDWIKKPLEKEGK